MHHLCHRFSCMHGVCKNRVTSVCQRLAALAIAVALFAMTSKLRRLCNAPRPIVATLATTVAASYRISQAPVAFVMLRWESEGKGQNPTLSGNNSDYVLRIQYNIRKRPFDSWNFSDSSSTCLPIPPIRAPLFIIPFLYFETSQSSGFSSSHHIIPEI